MRRLIFVVAYEAERFVERVLRDIPSSYINSNDDEILVIDDASRDGTFDVANRYRVSERITNMRVFKNPINQGYGGNQKIGYRYAIEHGFDVVAMVHGDWQYTPTVLPELFEPFENDRAVGCVLGVRFGRRYSPLRGGMPLYKYVGNRMLTGIQNRLAEAKLKEWHTGYRVYRVDALKRIAFELNTNDFHFDTEIILQLVERGIPITEIDIPTRYGDEVCRVQGMKYARDVLKASLKFRLQKYNLFYDIRFQPHRLDLEGGGRASMKVYGEKMSPLSPHGLVCRRDELTPPGSTIMDIGCSTGYVSRWLAEKKGCRVIGIDLLPASDMAAVPFEYRRIDLETGGADVGALLSERKTDVVLMLDVLEHLSEPEIFLLEMGKSLRAENVPTFIFSTGNVAFVFVRLMLLFGHFNYGERGILDITHKRLFSLRTFRNLLEQTGFSINDEIGVPFPFEALGLPTAVARALERINMWLIRLRPSLFSYQVLVIAKPLVSPKNLLSRVLTRADLASKAD